MSKRKFGNKQLPRRSTVALQPLQSTLPMKKTTTLSIACNTTLTLQKDKKNHVQTLPNFKVSKETRLSYLENFNFLSGRIKLNGCGTNVLQNCIPSKAKIVIKVSKAILYSPFKHCIRAIKV